MITLAITSRTIPLPKVEALIDTRIVPKLSQLSGVGLVTISGGQKPAVRIQANPAALPSYGIDLEVLRTALVQASVNAAKGSLDGPRQSYQIDANDHRRRRGHAARGVDERAAGGPGANTILIQALGGSWEAANLVGDPRHR